ncbi:MAG: hypothetical protein U0V04_19385 [Spirosomataceae bacterium]|jgi:hypothetical protein
MKNNNLINKIAGLLLLLSVFSAHFVSVAIPHKVQKESKATDKKENKSETVLQQINPETVVPSYHFHFQHFELKFPEPVSFSFESNKIRFVNSFRQFLFAYFDVLFEHIIVTNAP